MMRLFFAVPLVDAAAAALETVCARMHTQRGWHWLDARNWHITLSFLGDTDGALVPALCDLGERVAQSAQCGVIALDSLQWWPSADRPRLLAAVGEAMEPLIAMRKMLNAGLRELGVNYDAKPLRPHVTLMRLERGVLVHDLGVPHCAVDIAVDSVALYRSERERGETFYRPLWEQSLPSPPPKFHFQK